MSLPILAQHIASKGRNGDSVLVHMTPGEVRGLHALAAAHGGMLTVNPETGLVEASFLKSILPMIAGAALNFFLPGVGTAIGSALGGLSGAAGTAIAVGGITGLATGSLQKGLMAGLGAYGGAGLAEGLAGAGQSALVNAAGEAAAKEAAAQGLTGGAYDAAIERATQQALSSATPASVASSGIQAIKDAPMAFAKSVAKPLMYAAAPIMADQMVPTTTGMPESKPGDTGYIRSFAFDPYTQGLQSLGVVPANRINYPPPPGGATGGLVALANGGAVRLAGGGLFIPADVTSYTAEQKADLYNKLLSQGYADTAIRQAATQQFGVQPDTDWTYLQNLAAKRGSPDVSGAERYALTSPDWRSRSGQTGIAGLNANINQWAAENPAATYAAIAQEAGAYGVDKQDILRALEAGGGSKAMQFVTTAPEWQSRSGETGLAGLSSNINRWLAENPNATRAQAYDEMAKWGLNENDVLRATGKTVSELFPLRTKPPVVVPPPEPPTIESPTIIDAGTRPGYTGREETYGGTDVIKPVTLASLGEAGKVTRDTMSMADVRNAVGNRYAPQTFLPFTPSVTGASKSAYDYLMGRGEYPVVQKLPGGAPLMRPYFEVAGITPVQFNTANAPATSNTTTGSIGFKPPTTGSQYTAGVQRWRNVKTGEIYLAPTGGYTPPNDDWVLETDTNNSDLTNSGVGVGSSVGNDGGGFGDGESAKAGGLMKLAMGGYAGGGYNLGSYSDGGRLLRGPGDGVSDSIPATIGRGQPARLADGEFVVPARIVSELGNGSTEAGARKLYAMMDRVQRARRKTTGKNKVAANTKAERFLPA